MTGYVPYYEGYRSGDLKVKGAQSHALLRAICPSPPTITLVHTKLQQKAWAPVTLNSHSAQKHITLLISVFIMGHKKLSMA